MILIVLPDIPTEDRILARARQGDADAVSQIYEAYFEPVYQFIRLRVDDPALAEDLASEVFVKFITALRGRSAPHHTLRGWLFRVARNVLHDHYGQAQRFSTEALDDWLPTPDGEDLDSQVIRTLDAERVRRALGRLPADQQEVLILRFGQALSLQETADLMGRQVGAIKSLQFRAVESLRRALGEAPLEAVS
jgi:RNA polymerase sigma-70 factor (ECF subfamily)